MLYQDGTNLVKYDLQKKETIDIWDYTNLVEDNETVEIDFFQVGDFYVAHVSGGKNSFYAQKTDGTGWEKCAGDNNGNPYNDILLPAQTSHYLFYTYDEFVGSFDTKGDSVWLWKCDGKEIQQCITKKQVEKALRNAKQMEAGDKVDVYCMDNVYAQDDRCYIQTELGWYDGKIYRMECLLFSQGEDETELRYERELTECMQSHVKSRNGFFGDGEEKEDFRYINSAVVNDAQCVYILNGTVYLSLYDYEKDKGRMGAYELSTGKFHWISEKEAAFGELAAEGADEREGLDDVFVECRDEDVEGNPGEFWIDPADVEEQGYFYETK